MLKKKGKKKTPRKFIKPLEGSLTYQAFKERMEDQWHLRLKNKMKSKDLKDETFYLY